ncbi:MAG TPA: hypoxanthine phosphoribosyltransferase [Thermodesulfobacteriota bacterium]|nr:hypoxanthine phosphoribosyltransferase [Deltaproteobacteria bacterium]HNR13203.1 hypoxanthine phosphoribosyltransferase [Thermodesulfobacteriota bacterium]HNU71888.1 hypoxanthine phosphoribosyltransferase [Thermodesulfobacteriota bacterium]HOC38762.1 hypoxanthine phosphoribosyltransferase [Thermodesulfobacteriota bacterium]HQO77652.1 hypoxanthine phosphoribosyltransferase [Thermodesulfobacteriota bacterium]
MEQKKLTRLFSEKQIKERVAALADQIDHDYPAGEILLVGILKGAFIFLADLIRNLSVTAAVDFVQLSSYGMSTTTSGRIHILKDIGTSIQGRDVIIVEDIVDTGLTVRFLKRALARRLPHSVKVCALLDKKFRREVVLEADYVGFTIDQDYFIVGYGLDCAEHYRQLPEICHLET